MQDEGVLLVQFEDAPYPVEVPVSEVETTDIPQFAGAHASDIEWWRENLRWL